MTNQDENVSVVQPNWTVVLIAAVCTIVLVTCTIVVIFTMSNYHNSDNTLRTNEEFVIDTVLHYKGDFI